jgi:hypothetical protein
MEKVTMLPGITRERALGEPNGSLVRCCEQLLERARRGELQQLVAGGLDQAGNPVTLFAVDGRDLWSMHGVLSYLLQEHGRRVAESDMRFSSE